MIANALLVEHDAAVTGIHDAINADLIRPIRHFL
jgi:hypothetical protein